MTWVVAAVAGSSIVSGYMGAKAAKDAARIQSEAADRAAMQQREMFDISRADLEPYRRRGYMALSDIERMMPYFTARVGQPMARQAAPRPAPMAAGGYSAPMLGNQPVSPTMMGAPIAPGVLQPVSGGSTATGGAMLMDLVRKQGLGPSEGQPMTGGELLADALRQQAGSVVTDPQTGRQFTVGEPMDMSLDTTQAYDRAIAASQAPMMAQDMYMPSQAAPMGDTLLSEYLDPSMAFRMKYGTQATERLGNVAGGALSGNTMRALQEFGQGLASTEYANAFQRAQSERSNIYNTLANIAGMGQGAVNTGVAAQQTLGQSLAGLTTGAGAAQAAGQVGAANAYSQALQTPMNYLQLSALLGRNPFGPVAQTSGIPGGAPTSSGVPYTSNLA